MIPKPYQEVTTEGRRIRRFLADTQDNELIWHFDEDDRKIKILQAGNWLFQRDNELPILLENNMELFIKKMEWHRILAGDQELIIEIETL